MTLVQQTDNVLSAAWNWLEQKEKKERKEYNYANFNREAKTLARFPVTNDFVINFISSASSEDDICPTIFIILNPQIIFCE